MKKLLSILGSITLAATASSSVVACGGKTFKGNFEFDGDPQLNDPTSIRVKLKGPTVKSEDVTKRVTVEGYHVSNANIASNLLIIDLKEDIIVPSDGSTLSISIVFKNNNGKDIKTVLKLQGSGQPGQTMPWIDPQGKANSDFSSFTFKTGNIIDTKK